MEKLMQNRQKAKLNQEERVRINQVCLVSIK